ncbi:MAG: hypothetical protein F6K31_04680 [Symploca sp. SIO2G7]|nr:hypothetical protein [Symploca sp. SIO2G7]
MSLSRQQLIWNTFFFPSSPSSPISLSPQLPQLPQLPHPRLWSVWSVFLTCQISCGQLPM